MAQASSASSSYTDSSLSSASPGGAISAVMPDAKTTRDPQSHFTDVFKVAAVRSMPAPRESRSGRRRWTWGSATKPSSGWINDARPDAAGIVDVHRFDELSQLRSQNRELLARNLRLTAERDFLKKCASYFAAPINGGSK
jgi:hypothetical protein